MGGEPLDPSFVFLRQSLEEGNHALGVNLGLMEELQAGQIRFGLLSAAEFQRHQFHAELFHNPTQPRRITQHDRHHGHKTQLLDDPFEPMSLEYMVQLVGQDPCHLFGTFCFFHQSGKHDNVAARQLELGILPAGTKLTPRHATIPSWDSRTADEKRVYTRLMENYAAYMEYTDAEIGRYLDSLAKSGELDNTLVMYVVGDNGASAEGGLEGTFSEIA
ncbi:MAG: sulfatase-like hydrolase/transferase, partial [Nitrospira sp.]|nr:sulfatase-like hydrolase/transferase [Nitrospira sp.]